MRSIHGSHVGFQNLYNKRRKKRQFKLMNCYAKRNERLGEIGYPTYLEYLKSKDWIKIRTNKLNRHPTCLLCPNPASQVHHMSYDYETLLGVHDYRLVQLCGRHHQHIEFSGDRKRHLKEANRTLFELANQCERGKKWIEWHNHQYEIQKRNRRIRNRRTKAERR